jgi:sulfite reductase (ferredoxin)
MAELGFVGSAPDSYQVWLGGSPDQTRLAEPFVNRLAIDELETFLEPIFVYFKQDRKLEESFGDFCHRVGFDSIRQFITNYSLNPSMNIQTQEIAVTLDRETLEEVSPSVTPSDHEDSAISTQPSIDDGGDPNKIRHRVSVRHQTYLDLREESKRQGKPVVEIATQAIEEYLSRMKAQQ